MFKKYSEESDDSEEKEDKTWKSERLKKNALTLPLLLYPRKTLYFDDIKFFPVDDPVDDQLFFKRATDQI